MVDDRRVSEVQLNEVVIALPAFIPETVVVIRVPVKREMEPVLIGGVPFFLLNVFKSPKASADMVEDAVYHDLDVFFMERINDFFEIVVRSEPFVDQAVISCIVAVSIRLEDRREIYRVDPEFFHMGYPVKDLKDPVF